MDYLEKIANRRVANVFNELVKSQASLEYAAVCNANRMRKETPWQGTILELTCT